ncbi:hypothetical protein L7F22_043605 [Adiantum nelumboides]|nr:hypothetical protein [Adiantum nelumboides]
MSNGGATTVYPPQPYAPTGHQMGSNQPGTSVLNQTHPSPSMKPAGNLQDPGMSTNAAVVNAARNHINGGTPSRKRTASASPSMEAKEKKTRNEIVGGTSPAGTRPASVNGIRPDQHRQGSEEASKLDVYVWDYLTRRGFNNTAKILQNEARLGESPDVALKTPQGLLYEYWAVFWEGLAARSGRGNIDANAFPDKTQRINEIVRRTEAMESGINVTDNLQRLASGIVGGQAVAAGQMFGQLQQGQRMNVNGQQINAQSQQQQPQALQQQPQQARTPVQTPGGTPIPMQGQMAGWNANPGTAVQQQTQMLIMAAQRHNISLDELKNMNPTMRNALIQSVTGGQQNQVGGATGGAQNVRPGMTPGAAVASAAATAMNVGSPFDQSMHQRMQQFQQQTQQQRNAAQAGIRPGMMGGPQSGPGTPGGAGTPTMNGQPGMDNQQRPAGQIPGQPGMATPQMHPQTPQSNQQVQTPGGQAPGGPNNGIARPMQPGQVAGTPGNVSGPMTGQEASMHPRLTTEQQQMLMSQHQTLQQTLRQEVYHAQHAPTPAIAERSFQNAQQIQMRLGQLSALLKAQPGLQQQAALFQQQQQQQQQQQVAAQQAQQLQQLQQQQAAAGSAGRPGMPPGMQAGLHGIPSGFPPGLTPQQQQQFLAQRAAQMQNRPPQGDQSMMMNMMAAQGRPPQQQQQPQQKKTPQQQQQFNNAGMMSLEAARQQQLQQQQQQQQQLQQFHQQQQQQNHQNAQGTEIANTPGSENQARTPFAFANPFAATAGARSQGQSQSDDPGHPQSAGLSGTFQQVQPNHQMGAPGQRPMSAANRMGTGMGPPQNISSPSPRMQQNNMLTEGSVTGSPAQIPSTPKTANAATPASQSAAEKKKKEPARGRKNSKAVNNNANANKTPVLGAATTPSTQAQTPAGNNNMPTPGRDTKAANATTPAAAASSTALNASINAPVGPASTAMAGMMSMPPNAFEQNNTGNGLQSSALNNNNSNNTNSSTASSTTTAPSNGTNATLSSSTTSATSAANTTANASNVPSNIGTDDLSQMFNSGDMSQFLNDFDFPSGGAFGSGDGSGLGAFGDSWDTSNLGNLFGDTLS